MSIFRRRLLQQALAVPKPIASYECYDLTNEGMAENPVLTDLTGNGHDITCHNFAWGGMSGIGGYHLNFSNWNSDNSSTFDREITSSKVTFYNLENLDKVSLNLYKSASYDAINGITFKVSGLETGESFEVSYKVPSGEGTYILLKRITSDGELTVDIPASSIILLVISGIKNNSNRRITIEQLPLHKGALVSDGVDDYGICENFPILTKEKGYTVVALRKPINIDSGVYVSKRGNNNGTIIGAFVFEKFQASSPDYPKTCYSFGYVNKIDSYPNLFSYMTSKSYNGKSLTAGNINDDSYLIVFAGFITITDTDYTVSEQGSCALYALEIYDRDLSDAEIAKVKARMIKQYESKTGLKYEEV